MISALGASSVFLSTNSKTSSAKFSSSVTKKHDALGSCSACDNMSVAIYSALAVLSASISTSDGPAGNSMSTSPYTNFLAAVTKMFPGPTIFSTLGMLSVL